MNLAKISLWPYAIFSIATILLIPVVAPQMRLNFLAPCLVILFYQKPLVACLWIAFAFGLLIDVLTPVQPLGLHASSYCAATALLYPQKRHFFADNLSTLPILTALTAMSITLLQAPLAYMFHQEPPISAAWLLTNLVVMPLCDAAYATTVFTIPKTLLGKRRRYGGDYFVSNGRLD